MEITNGIGALVTGAAGGMGLATARCLAAASASVIMADIDGDRLQAVTDDLVSQGLRVLAVQLDVRDQDGWFRIREQAHDWCGGIRILCNTAGVVFQGPIMEAPLEVWRFTQAINVEGPFLGIRAFLPGMLETGQPCRIVNTASLAGLYGESKLAAYSASKFALVGLSEALQLELARTAVGVTVVFPGPTATEIGTSTQRIARSEGVAPDARLTTAITSPPRARPALMDPAFIGARVLRAIQNDEFYVVTHPDWRPLARTRWQALDAAFAEPAEPGYSDDPVTIEKMAIRLANALGREP